MISKMSTFQIFPNLDRGGGGHQISMFSQVQKNPNYPGGSRKLLSFPQFVTFFLMAPLIVALS